MCLHSQLARQVRCSAQVRYFMRKFLLLSWVVLVLPLVSLAGLQAAPEKKDAKPGGRPMIAVFRLRGTVTESPSEDVLPFLGETSVSFKDLVARFKKTEKDASVKAIVLLSEGVSLGAA